MDTPRPTNDLAVESVCPTCGRDVSRATEVRCLPDGRFQWRSGGFVLHTQHGIVCEQDRIERASALGES